MPVPRVIEQNLKIKLPPGSHTAEFQFNHGMVDMVINRRELRGTVSEVARLPGAGGRRPTKLAP